MFIIYIGRSVCRRAERSLVPLLEEKCLNPDVFKFINRLSDYFFTLARAANKNEGKDDAKWDSKNILI
jgi:cob(I)alamin adenosyltransferase